MACVLCNDVKRWTLYFTGEETAQGETDEDKTAY